MKTPAHLEAFPWYAKHQSWLASQRFSHHEFPDGASAERANLCDADLYGANLKRAELTGANLKRAMLTGAKLTSANLFEANLYEANLTGASLKGASLSEANLKGADLAGADLTGAHLTGAHLPGAHLYEANLKGADLAGANLNMADLTRAIGIASFGPCPGRGRIGYAVLHNDCIMVQLGCWWASLDDTLEKLKSDRTPGYVALVKAAALVLQEQKEAK